MGWNPCCCEDEDECGICDAGGTPEEFQLDVPDTSVAASGGLGTLDSGTCDSETSGTFVLTREPPACEWLSPLLAVCTIGESPIELYWHLFVFDDGIDFFWTCHLTDSGHASAVIAGGLPTDCSELEAGVTLTCDSSSGSDHCCTVVHGEPVTLSLPV